MKHVVVVGLLYEHARVLLCHRSPDRRWYPNVRDFPGGHVEPDERPERALQREMLEELGIRIDQSKGAPFVRRQVAEADLDLRAWLIVSWAGTVTNHELCEHDEIGWFAREEVAGLPLADSSYVGMIEDGFAAAERSR